MESLPVELVAHVATYLGFQHVCSLRLASRTLAGKLCPANLPRFFAYKNVKLDYQSLNDFVYMTYPGRAGCVLKHCTITGVIVGEPSEPALTRLLHDAFVNLKRNSPRASLVSLHINARSPPEDIWDDNELSLEGDGSSGFRAWRNRRLIRYTAQQTFEITMTALRECRLPVSEYFKLLGVVQGCSLSYCNALPPITQLASSMTVFSLLKKLTMSLSSKQILSVKIPNITYDQRMYDNIYVRQSMHGSSLLQGLLVILESMPHLEELDIRWLNITSSDLTSEEDKTIDLDIAPPLVSPPFNLKACSLRGLYVSGEYLLRYLQAARPTKLTLADIHLIPGTWTPIFEHLSSSISPTIFYHLDDLQEGKAKGEGLGSLVHFDGVPGQSKFPYQGVQMGPSTLTRQMGEVGTRIRYQCTTQRPLESGERERWLWSKKTEFSPPSIMFQ